MPPREYIITTGAGREEEGLDFIRRLLPQVTWPAPTLAPATATSDPDPDVAPGLLIPELGIVGLTLDDESVDMLSAEAAEGVIIGIELVRETTATQGGFAAAPEWDWSIQAMGIDRSPWTGAGVVMTVLDGSYSGAHPDLQNRVAIMGKFAPGKPPNEASTYHGTACLGIACAKSLTGHPRYGVAVDATVHFGKVLGDNDRGTTSQLLRGLYWAVRQGSAVVSVSVECQEIRPSAAFERVGEFALRRECLIVAPAGNTPGRAVAQPGNARSIMAVGSLNTHLLESDESSHAGIYPGSNVDLAAPGVYIRSAHPDDTYATYESGTSFAVPAVAGIAALWAQATGKRGERLWQQIVSSVAPLHVASRLAGAGMVKAPGVSSVPAAPPWLQPPAPGTSTILVTLDPIVTNGEATRLELEAAGCTVTTVLAQQAVKPGPVDPDLPAKLEIMPGVSAVYVDDSSASVLPAKDGPLAAPGNPNGESPSS